MDITLRMSDHALTARAAAAAGIVLLQNKACALPLLPQEDGSLLEENSELEYVWVAESDVPEAVLTAPLE